MLAVALTVAYAIIATICIIQLTRIAIFRHSLFSFQTSFLGLSLLWSIPRVIFFAVQTQSYPVLDLFLYWIPIDLQFAIFSLICVFYVFLANEKQWPQIRHMYKMAYCMVNVTVISLTLVYFCVSKGRYEKSSLIEKTHQIFITSQFTLLVAIYAHYGSKVIMPSTYNEVTNFSLRKMSPKTIFFITLFTWIIFLSRCVFNFLYLFGVATLTIGSESDSDYDVSKPAFVLYSLWEIVPISMLLIYFRDIPRTNFGWRTLFCFDDSFDSAALLCATSPSFDYISEQSRIMAILAQQKQQGAPRTSTSGIIFGRTRYDTESDMDSFSPVFETFTVPNPDSATTNTTAEP